MKTLTFQLSDEEYEQLVQAQQDILYGRVQTLDAAVNEILEELDGIEKET